MKMGSVLMSSIEYPKIMSVVVFLAKCPLRCPYCANSELLEDGPEMSLDEVIEKINTQVDFADAIVVSGGEPLVQLEDTINILKYARSLNLKTKVDTSGVYPEKVKKLIETGLVDYIAMDIKAPFKKYKEIIGADVGDKIKESMDIINASDVYLECRTTYCEELLSVEDIHTIAKEIECDLYTIQQFRNRSVLNPELVDVESPNPQDIEKIAQDIKQYLPNTQIDMKTAEFGQKTVSK